MDEWNADIASSLYRPLEGNLPIRLLVIHPGKFDEPLKTELVPTTLDESRAAYDATSYTWGSPENPELISCGDSQLWIQRNAFNMILDLRRPDQSRKVWIDAICINQCSLDERAAQVAIMHHVYRRAGATWVWLGRPDEHSSAAMTFAATLEAEKLVGEFSHCQYGANWSLFAEKSYFFDPSFKPTMDAGRLRSLVIAIVRFLNRPWFSRVWIQQEASLCQNVRVICGPDTVDWDNLFALAVGSLILSYIRLVGPCIRRLIYREREGRIRLVAKTCGFLVMRWIMCPRYTESWPDYIHEELSRTINNIQAVRIIQKARHYHFQEVYGRSDAGLGFESLVESVSRYEATNPRDRIYAMGNIIANTDQWFEVDYRVPWEILYADVARRFIDVDALRFLKNAGRVRQEAGTPLPSWAPDYRYKEEGRYMISSPTLWKAGGNIVAAFIPPTKSTSSKVSQLPKGRKRQFPMSDDLRNFKGTKKLLLQSFASFRCLMSDEIIYVGDFVYNEDNDLSTNIAQIVESIRKDIDYIRALQTSAYINGDAILDAYKLTLIMSCDARQEIVRPDYVKAHWDDWFKWYEQGCPGYWDTNSETPVMNYSFESSGAVKTFRFAVTKHGYFCLVPRMVQIGDEIAIFQSYDLAVVLRRLPPPPAPQKQGRKPTQDTQDPYFELLGDAYVHGMMENEARCINDEFNCKYQPTQAQLDKMLKASDGGQGEPWATLDLSGQYERIFETLGPRIVRLV
ncbi:hypothetical protein F4859DRAFT_525119 [Xylaria cf. heliscus]|nr:hypothetical protein F4859DRAFT_525119 [Xylaria cf. heliscus]